MKSIQLYDKYKKEKKNIIMAYGYRLKQEHLILTRMQQHRSGPSHTAGKIASASRNTGSWAVCH